VVAQAASSSSDEPARMVTRIRFMITHFLVAQ
jgi:hypothetical protein